MQLLRDNDVNFGETPLVEHFNSSTNILVLSKVNLDKLDSFPFEVHLIPLKLIPLLVKFISVSCINFQLIVYSTP